jgi:TRAP-type mannitol/chloroaromatic compound transport system permease small subunit
MIGAPWLLQMGRHVRIDILPGLLPEQASRRLEQIISMFLLVVCLVMVVYAAGALQLSLKYQAMLYKAVTLPVWPFTAIFITSFSVISLELIVRLCTGRRAAENEPVSY